MGGDGVGDVGWHGCTRGWRHLVRGVSLLRGSGTDGVTGPQAGGCSLLRNDETGGDTTGSRSTGSRSTGASAAPS